MKDQIDQTEELARDIYDSAFVSEAVSLSLAIDLAEKGYRKQSEGMWEIVIGSNGKEKMVCTNCRHQQNLASTFTFCPNCGARMKGATDERAD